MATTDITYLVTARGPSSQFESDVANLRRLKSSLMAFVKCRLAIGRLVSMPSDYDFWGKNWEAHQWNPANVGQGYGSWRVNPLFPPVSLYFPATPWDTFTINIPSEENPVQSSHAYTFTIPAATPSPDPNVPCPFHPLVTAPHGNYIQDDNGDYDMIIIQGSHVVHYIRDNANIDNPVWNNGPSCKCPLVGFRGIPFPTMFPFAKATMYRLCFRTGILRLPFISKTRF